MKENKLISLMKQLDKRALTRLDALINSPYFNKKDAVSRYFDFLRQFHPSFELAWKDDERAYSFVFPQSAYREKEIGYLMSDLVKLIERFLMVETLEQNPLMGKQFLMEIYDKWDLDKAFNKTLRDSHKILEATPFRDHEFFHHSFQLYSRENNHFDKQKKHKMDDSLQKAIDNLDLYYVCLKLKYCCEMMNRENQVVATYDIKLMDELMTYLENDPIAEEPAIAIYYHILLSLRDKSNVAYYKKVCELLEAHSHLFSFDEARGMFLYVINHCVVKIHMGENEFLGDLLSHYKLILDKGYVFDNGYLSPWTFMNITTAGIRNSAFEWTERFIRDYRKFLHPRFEGNAYNFNLAYLFFNQKKYQKAQELLFKVESHDIFYTCESKELLLRIYYMTEELEAFFSLAESFQVFIRRNKLIRSQKKDLYLNLIKFLRRLCKITGGNKSSLERLKTDVEATPRVSKKGWLIMQLNDRLGN